MNIIRFAENVQKLDANLFLFEILSEPDVKEFIRLLNTENQLLKGIGSDGKDLIRYVDDPFFESKEQALAYQAWKKEISPDPTKNEAIADFFINGFFHRTIFVDVETDSFSLNSWADFAEDIIRKEPDALGLNQDSIHLLIEQIREKFIHKIFKALTK